MELIQRAKRARLELNRVVVPGVKITPVEAIRVWTDPRGKTHFEYLRVKRTRQSRSCSHTGTLSQRGRRLTYIWARNAALHLRCGDCGAALD